MHKRFLNYNPGLLWFSTQIDFKLQPTAIYIIDEYAPQTTPLSDVIIIQNKAYITIFYPPKHASLGLQKAVWYVPSHHSLCYK